MQNLYSGKQDSSSSSEGSNEQGWQNGPDGLSGPAEEAEATSSKHNFPQTLVSSEKKTQWWQMSLALCNYAKQHQYSFISQMLLRFRSTPLPELGHQPPPMSTSEQPWEVAIKARTKSEDWTISSLSSTEQLVLQWLHQIMLALFWGSINETTETTELGPRKADDSGVTPRKQN